MPSPRPTTLGDHYLDTGPLFCFGDSQLIFNLYQDHFIDGARVTEAVVGEVYRNADKVLRGPALYDKAENKKKKAAKNARGMFKDLFSKSKERPSPEPDLFKSIRNKLHELTVERDGPNQHEKKNDGELESLYWACCESVQIIVNENDARTVADENNVEWKTFVDVARCLEQRQTHVNKDRIFRELQRISRLRLGKTDYL